MKTEKAWIHNLQQHIGNRFNSEWVSQVGFTIKPKPLKLWSLLRPSSKVNFVQVADCCRQGEPDSQAEHLP